MNAAFLIMSSAALAGADPAPAPAAPVVISGSGGCSNCGSAPAHSTWDPCCGGSKVGLFDKLKSRIGGFGKKSHGCDCAPAPAPCSTCGSSVANRPNLFDTLKSRLGSKKHHGCGPTCDPCGAAHLIATPAPAPTTPPPAKMPGTDTSPPKTMPKVTDPPKGNAGTPPVTGAGLTGTSPY